jgi:hypothetical protein
MLQPAISPQEDIFPLAESLLSVHPIRIMCHLAKLFFLRGLEEC